MTHAFVELAIPVDDLLSARSELLDLGFSELQTTDAWTHPYTALRLGTFTLGLHRDFIDAPTLVLTRPELAHSIRTASESVEWTAMQLDDDLFNFARCDSPSGIGLLLVEATTHASAMPSPIQELRAHSLSCATPTLTASAAFWAPFAQATSELETEPQMQITFDIDGLALQLVETAAAEPLLSLRVLNEPAFVSRLAHRGLGLQDAHSDQELGRVTLRDGLALAFLS